MQTEPQRNTREGTTARAGGKGPGRKIHTPEYTVEGKQRKICSRIHKQQRKGEEAVLLYVRHIIPEETDIDKNTHGTAAVLSCFFTFFTLRVSGANASTRAGSSKSFTSLILSAVPGSMKDEITCESRYETVGIGKRAESRCSCLAVLQNALNLLKLPERQAASPSPLSSPLLFQS